jgi:FkbM family methyltransferase
MYRRHKIARLIDTYTPRTVTHVYGGHRLTVALADPLAEAWYDEDWPRLREIDQLVRVGGLRPQATVFDIGAHQGVVALMLAAEVGPGGRVVAVEAQAHNASTARRNVELNHAANVEVLHAAIAARPGILHFADGLNGHVDTTTRFGNTEVQAVTVDQLAERFGGPDVVFLDVEGYEGKALEGAARTLAARRTSFFVEVHADRLVESTPSEIADQFAGYATWVALPGAGGEAEGFVPLADPPDAARFFLVASPGAR